MSHLRTVFGSEFQTALLSASIRRIGFACHSVGLDGGVRQEVQVLRWTQANQLTGQLAIIDRRLGGYPGGLQSGFALHLVDISTYEVNTSSLSH